MAQTPCNRVQASPTLAALALVVCLAPASAQLRIVDYNVARLNGDRNALRDVLAAIVQDDKPGFALAPHVFVFQEVRGADVNALEALIHQVQPPGVTYVRGTYTSSEFEDGNGGAQALFYRADMLTEVAVEHQDIVTGAGRLSDRWKLQLVGYPTSASSFYMYSSHLRAGDDASDSAERLAGVNALRANADALPQGTHIIFAGDMNFGSSSEAAYMAFFNPGNSRPVDPLGTGTWAGATHAIKHSQSPRDVTIPELTGGGMDDRFDFQLSSEEFHDGIDLELMSIPFAYRSLGNDAQHYNLAINNGNNFYYPGQLARSNALATALFGASDHVPVVVEYRLPALLSASMPLNLGLVLQGAGVTVPVAVANLAPALVPQGAEALHYTVVGSGVLSGTLTGSVAALAPPTAANLVINTAALGFVSGTAVVSATGTMAGGPLTLHTIGTIIRHANPSFSSAADLNSLTVTQAYDSGTGTQVILVPVFNFGYDSIQALLDVDGVSGVAPPFAFVSGLQQGVGSQLALLAFSINTNGLAPGLYHDPISIALSDQDLPGALGSSLSLTLNVTINGSQPILGDLNGDGHINGLDLAQLLGAWTGLLTYSPCPPFAPADLNSDCKVNGLDLALLLGNWG